MAKDKKCSRISKQFYTIPIYLKGNITDWSDIVFLLKLCILQEERLTGWKMK